MDGVAVVRVLSWEFRVEALSRVEDGESLASVARRMGFNKETLRDWVAEYGYRFRSGRQGAGLALGSSSLMAGRLGRWCTQVMDAGWISTIER
ncbi:transposase [Ruania alkalisoli]|uniref:Transposase n=1 Tax=Ruania alkalisoli TaxID=2779775 RepID=A0A7M1SRI2_9MICO|nr:transposase [Ruania alkalisoli]